MKLINYISIIAILSTLLGCQSSPIIFYIAPNGSDQFSGKFQTPNSAGTDGPFASIQKAQEAVSAFKSKNGFSTTGITVCLLEGTYPVRKPLQLTQEDSGSPTALIVWRACPGQKVRLTGGAAIDNFQPVADPSARNRLNSDVRDKILQADLKSLGIAAPDLFAKTDSTVSRQGQVNCELIYLDQPMQIARWPNRGYAKITAVTDEDPAIIREMRGSKAGKIIFKNDCLTRWKDEKNGWLHGFWYFDWSDSFQKIIGFDLDKNMILLGDPQHWYGYREGQRFYALNLLCELDQPGEWCVDSDRGLLYFYPPAPLQPEQVTLSLLTTPMMTLNNASYIQIRDITFESSLATPVTITGGSQNQILGCTFQNLAFNAVSVNGGDHNGVQGCTIHNTGVGGIVLNGGDRKALPPATNYAINNHIHHFSRWKKTNGFAIDIGGVGNRVAHNLIHDSPHIAINLAGNDHRIEFNDINHVGLETNDAGAFYMARDWTQRGNIIRYNYFHDLGTGDFQAIYLDDFTSGTTVFGNIFAYVQDGVFVNSGRDNIIENNFFIHCTQGVRMCQIGVTWFKDYFNGADNTLFDRLAAVNGTKPPYSEKYPPLATLINDQPDRAKGNKILRNIEYHCDQWLALGDGLTENTDYLTLKDNLRFGDPAFVSLKNINYRLADDSNARKLGIEPIPVEKIGLLAHCRADDKK
jgi:hypothetical protein